MAVTNKGLQELGFVAMEDYVLMSEMVDGNRVLYIAEWKSSSPQPTEAELEAGNAMWKAKSYARSRASEYPPIGDQLDMIYKDMKNGTTTHAEAVEEVKTKHPKG